MTIKAVHPVASVELYDSRQRRRGKARTKTGKSAIDDSTCSTMGTNSTHSQESQGSISTFTHSEEESQYEQELEHETSLSTLNTHEYGVRFSQVEIVELAMELGDHPACRVGPPVQLSDRVHSVSAWEIEEFELERSQSRRCAGEGYQALYLSSSARRCIVGDFSKVPKEFRLASGSPRASNNKHLLRDGAVTETKLGETARRLMVTDHRVNDMMKRVDSLDQRVTARRRRRQQC